MKYLIGTVVTAALMITATTVCADNRIPSSALNDMGLSGLTVMSDSEAMQVRGAGAFAGGVSWAIGPFGTSGTVNVYGGHGKYEASGAGGSIAGGVRVRIKHVENSDGTSNTETRIRGYAVFAGGFATARAF
jgi:hypothetical protein